MKREHFVKVVEEALDSLPQEFRSRIRNVAVLVEDLPPNQLSPQSGQQKRLLLGVFHGVPATKKSIFDLTDRDGMRKRHRANNKHHFKKDGLPVRPEEHSLPLSNTSLDPLRAYPLKKVA